MNPFRRRGPRPATPRPSARFQPRVESLDDRIVPAAPILYAAYNGYGTYAYDPNAGTWRGISSQVPSQMVSRFNSDLYAVFGNGVWEYNYYANTWTGLTNLIPTAMDESEYGYLVASFAGYGTYSFDGGVWQGLTNLTATHLAGANGSANVYATFPGYGTWHDTNGNWSQVSTNTATAIAATDNGWLFAAMPDGTWALAGQGWQQITSDVATRLAAASRSNATYNYVDLYANYSNAAHGNGLFEYESASSSGQLTYSGFDPVITQVTGFQATTVSVASEISYNAGNFTVTTAGLAGLPALGTYMISGANLYEISSLTPVLVAG